MLLFLVTADKGLCGSFNSHLVREASSFIVECREARRRDGPGGAEGARLLRAAAAWRFRFEMVNLFTRPDLTAHAEEMAETAIQQYTSDGERLARRRSSTTSSRASCSRQVIVDQLLPIPTHAGGGWRDRRRAGRRNGRSGGSRTTCSSRRRSRSSPTCFRTMSRHSVSACCWSRRRRSTRRG